MTVFAPKLFRDILANNHRVVNFEKSLDISANHEQIKRAGESGGGASGELFLFSHDHQLILKTITQDEYKVLTDLLYDYSVYMKIRPDSMISKIYGLFEFEFPGTSKPVRLVIMENLFTVNNDAILRRYDLKGSTYSRKAFNGNYSSILKETKV